ncbi:hypothetical protein [Mycobacterium talmoniae]|uniref:Uncharacterized protein n=1 Tax=Mycobacterium talmoniae TaxID=1858794 RepID=A0A2S8BLI8_9MYCO|nr:MULTISPECIES: hypothetical protein [Mycobacterium]PQM47540.1 hypothetical protein C1Y40_02240 [Mycobacterium talmoniae]TDH54487.1 hypothetical protein E2F47_11540 [Mycobacterium eburneum]
MRLDTERHDVRAIDEEQSASSEGGVSGLSQSAEVSRGQLNERSFEFTFNPVGALLGGGGYNYSVNTNKLKKPLKKAVTDAGWTYLALRKGKP